MSVFEELLKKYCPDGVEYKTLSEIGEFSNIGVDKKKVDGEKEILLLNFIDVMKNMYIDKSIPKMVVTASDYKIEKCTIEEGDIFITPSSETIDEIGFASVITETIPNACYSYHIMRFRLFEYNMTTSIFIRYCFDSSFLRKQIRKSAQGITRFGLTLNKWKSLKIPFPPIEVQKEIVRILDTFTKYQDLLNRELELRKKQYEYYQNKLLFNSKFDKVKMSDICTVNQGLQIPISQRKKEEGKNRYFYITVQFLKGNNQDKYYIENPSENVICDTDDILVTRTGSTGKIITGVKGCFHNNFFKLNFFDNVNRRYVYYVLSTKKMYEEMLNAASGGTVPDLTHKAFYKLEIYFPPLDEQERIVNILDKFDALCNDITKGLPAEIELRKKQYEYYRDKLLTFKEKKK
ncbi:restriction endonuclease subunit S [Brachyspira pilosicoli]|uniref:restriction endonuclease subunit S n=1 Tax=Brachyspira pilosicoli TaxID=52584 RepID=UPI0030077AE3